MFRIAFDEDGQHAEPTSELDVRPRVAEDGAGFGGDIRKFCASLIEEAGKRLAAVALGFVVWAEVEGVDVGVMSAEVLLEGCVDVEHVRRGVEAECDSALIGDDDDAESGAIELRDRVRHAGQRLEFAGGSDVTAFGHLAIEDAIAVEEDGVQGAGQNAVFEVGHAAMITTGWRRDRGPEGHW